MKPATAQTNSRLDYNRASNTLQKDPSSRLRQFVVCSIQKIHPPCHLRSMLLEEPDGNGHKRLCTASDLVKHSLNIFKKRPKQSTVPREIDCPQEHCKKHPRSDIFPWTLLAVAGPRRTRRAGHQDIHRHGKIFQLDLGNVTTLSQFDAFQATLQSHQRIGQVRQNVTAVGQLVADTHLLQKATTIVDPNAWGTHYQRSAKLAATQPFHPFTWHMETFKVTRSKSFPS